MKTVIWDYNGTILDDLDICLQIENEMLKERRMPAWPVDRETYLDHFGFPVIDYYYYIGYTF
ncbi:MAG: HAD family hydrolase, partial [Solobacterium sp.]|nr:HAD family hydrolase [Solobacterium sp.]